MVPAKAIVALPTLRRPTPIATTGLPFRVRLDTRGVVEARLVAYARVPLRKRRDRFYCLQLGSRKLGQR